MNDLEFQECEEARTGKKLSKCAVVDSDTTWFCSKECQRVYETLDGLVSRLGPLNGRRFELIGSASTKHGRGMNDHVHMTC
jgi:hypothetical protein